jgi:tol-pal system protein YbgF
MSVRPISILGFVIAMAYSFFSGTPDVVAQNSSFVNELERLRRDMNTLQTYVFRGGKGLIAENAAGVSKEFASQDAVSQLQLQIQEMRRLMREMNGPLEELQFKMKRSAERLDKLVADVDLRLRVIEEGQSKGSASSHGFQTNRATGLGQQIRRSSEDSDTVTSSNTVQKGIKPGLKPGQQAFGVISSRDLNQYKESGTMVPATANEGVLPQMTKSQQPIRAAGVSAAPGPAPVTSSASQTANTGASVLPEGTPEEQYKHAYGLMMKRNMSEAESVLRAFLARHPKHELADNAGYWLGETHYARKDFQEAIRVYYDAYKNYPKGNKAPAVLLKLGMSLTSIGEKESACSAYEELVTSHPDANPRILRKASRMSKKLGCK